MQKTTGFLFIFLFIFIFSFAFIGMTEEVQKLTTVDDVLAESISLQDLQLQQTSYIYDRNNAVISEIYSPENRISLRYEDIPSLVIQAMIATEDQHFFEHKGLDLAGIARAFFVNVKNQQIEQGGSTITQQLVRNLFLNHDRTYNRKLSELLYAYQIEKMLSKEEILELYVNAIYFHNGAYGIEAASQLYFSKPASKLTLAETAFLSAIPNNPTHYNPLENIQHTHLRKEWILKKMLEKNFIEHVDYNVAMNEEITLSIQQRIDLFPDYVTYIYEELEQLVGEVDGYNKRLERATTDDAKKQLIRARKNKVNELLASGIHIHTALQPELQKKVNESVSRHLPEKDIQAAVVMIDHQANEIVAISGGKQFQKFYFHRGFQAFRQPGSAIKPLLVYAPLFAETKMTPTSPVTAEAFCKNGYCPRNFGGAVYSGKVPIEAAFKHSLNTSAVYILDLVGVDTAFSYFNKLGFSNINNSDHILPAALGGLTYGVTPLEMAAAYTTFANNGTLIQPRAIQKIGSQTGDVLYEWPKKEMSVWDKNVNDKMRTLLTKVVTEGTGKRAFIPNQTYIGGKTGTTNQVNDLWFVGLNQTYTTSVWVGKDMPQSIERLHSRNPHLLIWRDVMR